MQWKICWSEDNCFAPAQKYLGDIAVHYDPLENAKQFVPALKILSCDKKVSSETVLK